MAEPTDAELVSLVREGDRESYSTLVARYQGHVYGLAYSLADNWADAQDIAQETFIRAYVNLGQLRDPTRFAPWLRRVAFGVATNWLKTYRPSFFRQLDGRVDLDGLEIPDFSPGPAEEMEKRELADAVQRAVASLPAKYRVPLTMFHLDGLSYQKVAEFLDVPLGTVQSLIHRARQRLREALGSYYTGEVTPMVQEVFDPHRLPAEFSREVWNLEYDVRGFSDLLALRACLIQSGVEVDYDDLLGYSGDAFGCDGMAYFSGRGHDVLIEGAGSYGFRARWGFGAEHAYEDIHSSLAQNRPCIAVGFDRRCLWAVVVIGEQSQGSRFLVAGAGPDPQWVPAPSDEQGRPNWVGQRPWAEGAPARQDGVPANWQPCPRFLLGERKRPAAAAARFRRALQVAVTCHRQEVVEYSWWDGSRQQGPVGRGYLLAWPGLIREWSQAMEREPLNESDPDPGLQFRDAYFSPVAHSVRRKAAAAFLRAHLPKVRAAAQRHLELAAKHYEKSAALSDRLFERLCGVTAVQGLDWYRRLQAGPSYHGEGEGGQAAAAAFAARYPDRWKARQAVMRRMHESLTDANTVDQACQAAEEIVTHDDAGIAEIERTLAVAG